MHDAARACSDHALHGGHCGERRTSAHTLWHYPDSDETRRQQDSDGARREEKTVLQVVKPFRTLRG